MSTFNPSIHFFIPTFSISGSGGLEPIPAVIRREAGYTLDRAPVHHREKKSCMLTLTPRVNLESPINLTYKFLGCGGKPVIQREPTCTWGEHANSMQKGGAFLPGFEQVTLIM